MSPIGSLLWRTLRVHQIFGANTDVGKTVLTTILCNASTRMWSNEQTTYLKPVSTGPENETDDRYTRGVSRKTLFQYGQAVSPHIAARGNIIPSNDHLLSTVHEYASARASAGPGWLFIETAGGVHSPSPPGTTQADLYAALRSPVVLVGDSRLGGISSTISAYESLRIRGYDIESVLLFEDARYGNSDYLKDYFESQSDVRVAALPKPPSRDYSNDEEAMLQYYSETSQGQAVQDVLSRLDKRHKSRVRTLESMPSDAHQKIWYPFTQQSLLEPDDIVVIDSARGSFFQTLVPKTQMAANGSGSLLQPSFDGSASWWTQGLGHGNPSLTMAAAYAAGRYGHVMFASAIHEPALKLATMLLNGLQNPRLSRVFFSDNGSTGMEVAVKMALRATRVRYGWSPDTKIGILGLRGAYHGDTMGVMDCAEPNTFNEKVEWYEGKGAWLSCPEVQCIAGEWHVQVPREIQTGSDYRLKFPRLSDIFSLKERKSRGEQKIYENYILSEIRQHLEQGNKLGALIIEPVVLGAGGMILVDPLFQETLTQVVRQNGPLFGAKGPSDNLNDGTWEGLPVTFDEVFTGLYRLGRFTVSSFIGVHPDISVHAKLLTGGVVPLCTTLASESIFKSFATKDKSDALLHGHSYTAHPIGCQVAIESLTQMQSMENRGEWDWAKSNGWTPALSEGRVNLSEPHHCMWSIWPLSLIEWISFQSHVVAGVWALGSVLAIRMRAVDGGGYTSTAAAGLREKLLGGTETSPQKSWNVHSRVLGDVLYIMGGQKTTEQEIAGISALLRSALSG